MCNRMQNLLKCAHVLNFGDENSSRLLLCSQTLVSKSQILMRMYRLMTSPCTSERTNYTPKPGSGLHSTLIFFKTQTINHPFLSGWSYATEPSQLSRSASSVDHLGNAHELSILVEKVTSICPSPDEFFRSLQELERTL